MRMTPVLVAAASLAFAAPATAEPMDWKIDPEHTAIAFLVEHVGYARLLGRFTEMSGTFTYDPESRSWAMSGW